MPAIAAFYATWYPTRWLNPGKTFQEFGNLSGHIRFAERATRKLSRQVFHGMMVHQAAMQNKQVFLFRLVDIGNELFAMAATVSRAHALRQAGKPEAEQAVELADLFCRGARRKIKQLFRDLWSNDDNRKYRTAMNVLKGRHRWLEKAIEGLEQNVAVAEKADKKKVAA